MIGDKDDVIISLTVISRTGRTTDRRPPKSFGIVELRSRGGDNGCEERRPAACDKNRTAHRELILTRHRFPRPRQPVFPPAVESSRFLLFL